MGDELGLLVLHDPKRATAELVQAFVAEDEPLPRVGDRCLVAGGDGRPLAIVCTTDVRVGPLSSVDDRFAWDEGEDDRSRAWWLLSVRVRWAGGRSRTRTLLPARLGPGR